MRQTTKNPSKQHAALVEYVWTYVRGRGVTNSTFSLASTMITTSPLPEYTPNVGE